MVFYTLAVRAYAFLIRLASLANAKAAEWVRGRKNWREQLRNKTKNLSGQPRIWVHCASYGEFEQGRPLIEALSEKYGAKSILLTFFSPSGYQAFHNYDKVGTVSYLPMDTAGNARHFLNLVNPELVIFIKYEFWLNYLFQLKSRNITTYLVSAVFKAHHPFFKWYGHLFRQSLSTFRLMFLQDEASAKRLQKAGIQNYLVAGDTRFDRVMEIKNKFTPIDKINKFRGDARLIVAGSTWPGDEELLLKVFLKLNTENVKLLIVPHEVNERSINATETKLKAAGLNYVCFTNAEAMENDRVMILDTMGLLSKAYYYASLAYIGGGFNGGLHNTLEAAVYGIPVTFYGNDYHRFVEVEQLLALGAATAATSEAELEWGWKKYLSGNTDEIKQALKSFFTKNANATDRVLKEITESLAAGSKQI